MSEINEIILYSNDCPNCKLLKLKLDSKNIKYTICSDIEEMVKLNFKSVPMLDNGEIIMNYINALKWIKEYK